MITNAPASSPLNTSGGGVGGSARERIRQLTQRRNEAIFASKIVSNVESSNDETFVDEFA